MPGPGELDSLTGLLNRRAFVRRLEPQMARARDSGSPLTVVLLDFDDFKHVNDHHGHLMGDEVLKDVAARSAI